jgi:hypothetical protein
MMTTVNRCPHTGGPENVSRCGCSLDFDCPHNGKCETEEDCTAHSDCSPEYCEFCCFPRWRCLCDIYCPFNR